MRGPRNCYPGAILHVINRFVDRHPFFKNSSDYEFFINTYFETAKTYDLETYAYCLMPNHFHIVLQTPSGEISKFLQRFLTRVAKKMNQTMNRKGHLFQGRSKTLIVDEEEYFSTVVGYTLLNPLRAGICSSILDYSWSSSIEMLSPQNSRISKELLFEKLFGIGCRDLNETLINEYFFNWLKNIDPLLVNKSFLDGHKGGFISSERFRKETLEAIERREKQISNEGRRKLDRKEAKIKLNWNQFQKRIKVIILNSRPEIELRTWQSVSKAIQQISWYIAFDEMGLSYEQIRKNEYKRGKQISVFGIVSAIRRIKKDISKIEAVQNVCNKLNSR